MKNSSLCFSSEKEAKESEERKVNTRTFLRHRFLSKDEETQKIPGASPCLNIVLEELKE